MAFSNPFDDPQERFTFAQCAGQFSLYATMPLTGRLGRCVSAAVTGVLPAVA